MLQIRYFSDLHLEFISPHKIEEFIKKIPSGVENEICILAGDVGNPYHANYDVFMNFMSNNFQQTFVIAGNHEFYNASKTIKETTDFLRKYFEKFNNICFLNNSYTYYGKNDEYCFIGTTLWSKIDNSNPQYTINDVEKIPQFGICEYNEMNRSCVSFLEETLVHYGENKKCIVITHHVPSYSLINAKYKTTQMKPYTQWFYCDMDTFIETHKDKIKCWFYGHTHSPSEKQINEIPFLCNPIGYPNENKKIDFGKTCLI